MTTTTLSRTLAIAFASGMTFASSPAGAWGQQAHAAIDTAAIQALPEDGPVFLRGYIDYIAASATLPDKWRSASEPFAKIEEDPNHGWFREQFAFLNPVPRSRYAFILALYREHLRIKDSDPARAARMNVRWTGTLPYAAMEQYGQLVAEMRMLRAARAQGDERMARILEQNCAQSVVRLGHYIGDGAQPLHDSVNSDGWRGDNPEGYTRDGAIHSLFESRYVKDIGLTADDVRQHMAKPSAPNGDEFEQVLAYLDRAGALMKDVYRLEKQGSLTDPANKTARDLIYERTAAGAAMLRDMIAGAWRESVSIPEKLDDPLNAQSPDYDPATGSAAPAARQAK